MKVCRICIQLGNILFECLDFVCFKCGIQGHYAHECKKVCFNTMDRCVCNDSVSNMKQLESVEKEESEMENECVSAEVANSI